MCLCNGDECGQSLCFLQRQSLRHFWFGPTRMITSSLRNDVCTRDELVLFNTHIHHTSYIRQHTSYIIHQTPYIIYYTSRIIYHTSNNIHHASYIIRHTSHIRTERERERDTHTHTSHHRIWIWQTHTYSCERARWRGRVKDCEVNDQLFVLEGSVQSQRDNETSCIGFSKNRYIKSDTMSSS